MKRTILATAILATSFGAMAEMGNPVEPIDPGFPIVEPTPTPMPIEDPSTPIIDPIFDEVIIDPINEGVPTPIKHIDVAKDKIAYKTVDALQGMDEEKKADALNNMMREAGIDEKFRAVFDEETGKVTVYDSAGDEVENVREVVAYTASLNKGNRENSGNTIKDNTTARSTDRREARQQERRYLRDRDGVILDPVEDVIPAPINPIEDIVMPPIEAPCEQDGVELCVPEYGDPVAPIEDMPTPIGAPDKVAEVKAKIKAHFDKEKFIGAPVEDESPVFGVDPIGGDPKHGNGENKGKVAKKVAEVIEERANEIRAELPEIGENATGKVIAASQNAQAQNQAQIDELYALGNQNASDIDTLFSEVDRLDTRIDQTQALNAATVNARPMVANGMTAFGAGVGYAGSEAALAIGVAHSFVDTGWSASGTLAASSDDVVVGGGVQYAF